MLHMIIVRQYGATQTSVMNDKQPYLLFSLPFSTKLEKTKQPIVIQISCVFISCFILLSSCIKKNSFRSFKSIFVFITLQQCNQNVPLGNPYILYWTFHIRNCL